MLNVRIIKHDIHDNTTKKVYNNVTAGQINKYQNKLSSMMAKSLCYFEVTRNNFRDNENTTFEIWEK